MKNSKFIGFSNGSRIEVLENVDTTTFRGVMSEIYWNIEEIKEEDENDQIE